MPTLSEMLAEWPAPIFVVLEGALFPNLPELLRQASIPARSLYLEYGNNASVVRTAPRLAQLDRRALDRLLSIDGMTERAVFWRYDAADEPALFRHLRTLNLVEIPKSPEGATDPPDIFSETTRTVIFRHWDPNIIELTLPIMTPQQLRRFFGSAQAIAIEGAKGAAQAKHRDHWPAATRSRLQFDATQMSALADAMSQRSRRDVAAYLREVAPERVAQMNELELLAWLNDNERQGRAAGLTTERALGQFASLSLLSRGEFARSASALDYLRAAPDGADPAIGRLMVAVASQLEQGRGVA